MKEDAVYSLVSLLGILMAFIVGKYLNAHFEMNFFIVFIISILCSVVFCILLIFSIFFFKSLLKK